MKNFFIILNLAVLATYGLSTEDTNNIQNGNKFENQNIAPTITNGTIATLGQFPYQVAITMNIRSGQGICGGALIRHRWVLTAAHCLLPDYTNFRVTFGTINALTGSNEWRSDIIPRDNFRIHQNFNETLFLNNIALIFVPNMPETLTNSPNVGFIDLPTQFESHLSMIGRIGTTSGFGRTMDNVAAYDPFLYFITNMIIVNDFCRAVFPSFITSRNLCIETSNGRSPCGSDAGGPMVVELSPQRRILVGIVSATPNFCTQELPVFFESVLHHREWIEAIMNGSSMISVSFALVAAVLMMIFKTFM